MGLIAALTASLVVCPLPQEPAPAPGLPVAPMAEVVLADGGDPIPVRAFGLGNGGVDDARRPGALRWSEAGCTTPAGIRIECRPQGVKLTFPSGRELLLAPDGFLHLREGGTAGPFESGLELRLGDGTSVRVQLSQSQRTRLRDVVVVHAERALQPWRRGRPANEIARAQYWGGLRMCCCGDGGEVYRAIAIGPLLTLDRVLVPAERELEAPLTRLVVMTEPLLQALAQLPRLHRTPDPSIRSAIAAVNATAGRGDQIFAAGAALRRVDRDSLRWQLNGGYELELALDGPRAPRLSLYAGQSRRPMVEWALGVTSTLYLNNPGNGQPGASRWRGNGVPMPTVAPELQARPTLFELGKALAVIRRLQR